MADSNRSKLFSVRHLRRSALIFILLAVIGISMVSVAPKLLLSAQQDTTWRYTRVGWQDSASWFQQTDILFERRIELVHPASIAAIILLSSFGMLLWSAEEFDVARLLEGAENVCRRAKPRSPCIDDFLE